MGDSDSNPRDVERLLARQRIRVRLALFLQGSTWTLPLALLAGTGVSVALRLTGADGPRDAWVWLAGAAAVAVLGAAVRAWLRTPSRAAVALELDRRLGTRELLIAACEAGPEASHPLAVEARRRAGERLGRAPTRRVLPLTRPRRWVPTLLTLVLLASTAWLPEAPETAAATPAPELATAADTLARDLDALATEGLPLEGGAAEAFERVRAFSDELADGTLATTKEALLALEEIERELAAAQVAATTDDRPRGPGGELAALLDELSADPLTADIGEALADGDVEGLRRGLESLSRALAPEALAERQNAETLERLAERLERLADELARLGFADEAEQLDELAAALRTNDLERARELLQEMTISGACQRMVDGSREAEVLREIGESLNLARFLLGDATPPKLGERREAGGAGRSGPFPGRSSTNEETAGYETGPPIVRDRRSDRLSDREGGYEALYDSHIVQAESWVDAKARGRLADSGAMYSETGRSLGVEGDARLPAGSFPLAPPSAEQRAAELERVPLGYRDLVRRYFSREAAAAPTEEAPVPGSEDDDPEEPR